MQRPFNIFDYMVKSHIVAHNGAPYFQCTLCGNLFTEIDFLSTLHRCFTQTLRFEENRERPEGINNYPDLKSTENATTINPNLEIRSGGDSSVPRKTINTASVIIEPGPSHLESTNQSIPRTMEVFAEILDDSNMSQNNLNGTAAKHKLLSETNQRRMLQTSYEFEENQPRRTQHIPIQNTDSIFMVRKRKYTESVSFARRNDVVVNETLEDINVKEVHLKEVNVLELNVVEVKVQDLNAQELNVHGVYFQELNVQEVHVQETEDGQNVQEVHVQQLDVQELNVQQVHVHEPNVNKQGEKDVVYISDDDDVLDKPLHIVLDVESSPVSRTEDNECIDSDLPLDQPLDLSSESSSNDPSHHPSSVLSSLTSNSSEMPFRNRGTPVLPPIEDLDPNDPEKFQYPPINNVSDHVAIERARASNPTAGPSFIRANKRPPHSMEGRDEDDRKVVKIHPQPTRTPPPPSESPN